ncbi:MAG: hypothetical protein B6U72_01125 [Candidatus Altiarchaeales archaeon ex4484_2]|nr:MAG: hypothetical protein B6U72_01125 [Candidatus Altiarchaeales archaeon ex4484_2]
MEMKTKGLMWFMLFFVLLSTILLTVYAASGSSNPTNVVVDFDSTQMDSSLKPGESGILNLVVENTGEYNARNVEVWIHSTARVNVNKKFYLGNLKSGESKTLPVWIKVDDDVANGLTGIKVDIDYHGSDSEGDPVYNQKTTWEIPVTVSGEPLFQVTPTETTLYKDSLNELVFEVVGLSDVEGMIAELSSSCLSVVGSSRRYVGDVDADTIFTLSYDVKPSDSGICDASLSLSYLDGSGDRVSDNLSIGLMVDEAGVDFKITKISYESMGPGDRVPVNISLKNIGSIPAEDVSLTLSLSDPFTPADTSERYLGVVEAGGEVNAVFRVAVGLDAEMKVYGTPLTLDYKLGGTSYSVEKNVGLDVSGEVMLEVIKVEAGTGSVKIEVANVGTRAAEGVKAILVTGIGATVSDSDSATETGRGDNRMPGGFNRMLFGPGDVTSSKETSQARVISNKTQVQRFIEYKADIDATKQTTFSFDASLSGPATLILEYNGPGNERVTQVEKVTVGGATGGLNTFLSSRTQKTGNGGLDLTTTAFYVVSAVIVLFAGYKGYGWWKSR